MVLGNNSVDKQQHHSFKEVTEKKAYVPVLSPLRAQEEQEQEEELRDIETMLEHPFLQHFLNIVRQIKELQGNEDYRAGFMSLRQFAGITGKFEAVTAGMVTLVYDYNRERFLIGHYNDISDKFGLLDDPKKSEKKFMEIKNNELLRLMIHFEFYVSRAKDDATRLKRLHEIRIDYVEFLEARPESQLSDDYVRLQEYIKQQIKDTEQALKRVQDSLHKANEQPSKD